MPQVNAVDGQFGTHRVPDAVARLVLVTGAAIDCPATRRGWVNALG
jgi:hypothetical protein